MAEETTAPTRSNGSSGGDVTIPDVCGCCGVEGSTTQKLKVCTGCRHIKYCSRRCQKLDRPSHKTICHARHTQFKTDEEQNARMQHKVIPAFSPGGETCFVYTCGIAESHPSKVEFISLDVPRGDSRIDHHGHFDIKNVACCFNFLAGRLLDGHEVRPNETAESGGVKYMVISMNDDVKYALLDKYARRCDWDVNLLLIMPVKMLPFTLSSDITLHKWIDPTTWLELALWKSKIDELTDSNAGTREQCHAGCGADIIIPTVLPFLTGVDAGGRAEAVVVGERGLAISTIRRKLMCQDSESGELLAHQMFYNSFNPHPSGKTSMQRGMLIRHLDGIISNNMVANLAECTIYDALIHIVEWTTDWVCFLSEEEQQFVMENVGTMREIYRTA